MTNVEIISALFTLWVLSATVVYCGGILPTHWQTPKTTAMVAFIGAPLAIFGIALIISYPALIVLIIIIAVTHGR